MNSILKTTLKTILTVLPLRTLLKYLLSMFDETVKKSKNKIDDVALEVAYQLIDGLDFGKGNISLTPELKGFFDKIWEIIKEFDISEVVLTILEYLEERAKDNDTNFDDKLVKLLRVALEQLKVI